MISELNKKKIPHHSYLQRDDLASEFRGSML